MQKRRKSQGLELVSIVGSESDVWQSGIRAAGPIRPSLPWCFSPATRSLDSSLDRSGAERKPAPGGAGWQLAVQKRRKSQGLELVSSRFRK